MSLDNLLGRSLERIEPDTATIRRLREAARRNIADAEVEAISRENRFDAAYKAIMQLANAALQASGYRTLTSQPGHHRTMLQSLPKTVGVEPERVMVLDKLRMQRNVADYSGDPVTAATMEKCVDSAKALLDDVSAWLDQNHPER